MECCQSDKRNYKRTISKANRIPAKWQINTTFVLIMSEKIVGFCFHDNQEQEPLKRVIEQLFGLGFEE